MTIPPVSLQAPFVTETFSPTSKSHFAETKQLYRSSLRSMQHRPAMNFAEFFTQLLETAAMLALLPFFTYVFFFASISLVFLPIFMIFVPLLFISEFFRVMLNALLPCFFPDPMLGDIF